MTSETSERTLGPYELGLSNSPDAVGPLIDFLTGGRTNEKRLAASAIRKLAVKYREECQAAESPLLACLNDPGPQVRQYALKALSILRLAPKSLDRLRIVQDDDDRHDNRDLATAILRSQASVMDKDATRTDGRAEMGTQDAVQRRIEACLDALDILEEDLQENLSTLWEAEDVLADLRHDLERAEARLIARGVDGKNESERRARLAVALSSEREAAADAERRLRSARRQQQEYQDTLTLIQHRLKALELLVALRSAAEHH